MADSFASASFEFSCSTEEMALLDEAFAAAENLACDFEPINPTPAFLTAFPPTKDGDLFSGLLALFDDPQFPIIGAELASGLPPDEPGQCPIHIFGTTDFEPRPLASIIQRCCPETLRKAPITFEWAYTATPARVGEFGGGRCAIFTDRIDIETTAEPLRKLVDEGCQPAGKQSRGGSRRNGRRPPGRSRPGIERPRNFRGCGVSVLA